MFYYLLCTFTFVCAFVYLFKYFIDLIRQLHIGTSANLVVQYLATFVSTGETGHSSANHVVCRQPVLFTGPHFPQLMIYFKDSSAVTRNDGTLEILHVSSVFNWNTCS